MAEEQQQAQENTEVGKELNAVAGLSRTARMGFVSMMFGILGAIIVLLLVDKFYSSKSSREEREVLYKIISDQAKEMTEVRTRTDTTLQSLSNKRTTP